MSNPVTAHAELQQALDTIEGTPRLPNYAKAALARARESAAALATPPPIGAGRLILDGETPAIECPGCGTLHTDVARHIVIVDGFGDIEPFDVRVTEGDLERTWSGEIAAFRSDCGAEFHGIDHAAPAA